MLARPILHGGARGHQVGFRQVAAALQAVVAGVMLGVMLGQIGVDPLLRNYPGFSLRVCLGWLRLSQK